MASAIEVIGRPRMTQLEILTRAEGRFIFSDAQEISASSFVRSSHLRIPERVPQFRLCARETRVKYRARVFVSRIGGGRKRLIVIISSISVSIMELRLQNSPLPWSNGGSHFYRKRFLRRRVEGEGIFLPSFFAWGEEGREGNHVSLGAS